MNFTFLILSLMLLVFGIVIGHKIGDELGNRIITSKQYWTANVVVLVVCVVLFAFFSVLELLLVEPFLVGVLAGCIVGLKMSFGESVGVWKTHDRIFNVNQQHQETAKNAASAQARRERRASGEDAPDVISVTDNDASRK